MDAADPAVGLAELAALVVVQAAEVGPERLADRVPTTSFGHGVSSMIRRLPRPFRTVEVCRLE